MTAAIVALGSNLGDRADFLDAAVMALHDIDGFEVQRVSPWYESIAHTLRGPDVTAPRYLNGVARIDSSLGPHETLAALLDTEQLLGRPADHGTWTDRTLDLDLITFGDVVYSDSRLTLPHPLAHERAFVLQPWFDIDPTAVVPGHGPVSALLEACPQIDRDGLTLLAGDR